MEGDVFRRAKSSAPPESGPPRHETSAARYGSHLPFQVFCCESGTHVVDPEQSYYKGIKYRYGTHFYNNTREDLVIEWDRAQPCQDSAQAWFCRDLWIDAARDKNTERILNAPDWELGDNRHRAGSPVDEDVERPRLKDKKQKDKRADPEPLGAPNEEAKAGSNADAMPEGVAEEPMTDEDEIPEIPNSSFRPARILMNPRCVTTYAGVSHSQLALDLFGDGDDDSPGYNTGSGKYVLEDWEGAPSSFACQEMRCVGRIDRIAAVLTDTMQTNRREESGEDTEKTELCYSQRAPQVSLVRHTRGYMRVGPTSRFSFDIPYIGLGFLLVFPR